MRALTTFSFLSLLLIPASAATAESSETRMITDFTAATPDLGWFVVNDGVMGGRSRGGFDLAGGAIDFAGSTDTDGGGFSSIRTRGLDLDLTGHEGIRVRVRGDGRRYTWRLTTDARWRGRTVSYRADFETTRGEWTTADIPFSRFRPQWRGRMLSGPALDPSRIRGMGLMIYDKKDGAFALRLDSVEAYRKPFSLAELRWKRRLLVLSSPEPDDALLRAQVLDISRTGRAFVERDLTLVVLTGLTGKTGSRAGDRFLSPREVASVRKALGIGTGAFALRLIGKDGGVKLSASSPVAMEDLYARIDSMPMRQREMRERNDR